MSDYRTARHLDGQASTSHSQAMINYMEMALIEAQAAADRGEVPVGCVIVDGETGTVLASTGNRTEELNDPTAHAEILAIRQATAKRQSTRLVGCDLYVTLEPCAMCATATSFARIRRLYFGAFDVKMGGVEHGPHIYTQPTCHHVPEVYGGINERAAGDILKTFFKGKR